MYPNDRFYGCESLGFPEVSNYDFDDNIPNRGIEDRNFRWEEVAAPTVYMLKEATSSGSFENNTFSYSNPTGVNYITTGITSGNSTNFFGWYITGSRTVWIGQSGIHVSSGDIPGVTGYFQAHPIDGDSAIGLYCSNTGISYSPGIYSTLISTGVEGPIVLDQKHQLYLQAKLNYGNTGLLKAYIRGWQGGSVVAYYNPFSGLWQSTVPTEAFTVNKESITTLKYDFICSSFPAATPTSFDIYITNQNSGSFVTVDNIHLDAYFKQNAFLDYLVPSGYMLQVTPDLGWHNILDMFDSSESIVNPHLKTLGPFVVDFGNLKDNLDNTVTATLDYEDFNRATTATFKKYLWRAVPLTPNGQVGSGGYPQRFNYIGDEINKFFTVDNIVQDDLSTLKVITGSKSKTMVILVDGLENNPGLSYPTTTSWRLEINVSSSSRNVVIRGKDSGGSLTSFKKITLTNKLYDQNSSALWNIFDEHGLVADVERLPKESNYDYSLRIKDSYRNRGGSTFVGIVNSTARELNLRKVPDGISLDIVTDSLGNYVVPSVSVETTSYSLRISTDAFIREDRLLVDPIFGTVELPYLPIDIPEFCEVDGIGQIPKSKISIVDQDNKSKYYLKIDDEVANGKFVKIKYYYSVELLFKNNKDLYSIIEKINNLTTDYGQKILTAKISSKLSGNEDSMGLYISNTLLAPRATSFIPWSPVVLKKIADRGYRDYFIQEDTSTLKNTKYYSFVQEIKKGTSIFWGSVEADRSRWDMADSKDLAMDSIPTLFDPPLTRILSVITGTTIVLDPIEAWGRSNIGLNGEYLSNAGLSENFFQPGVAHTKDLEPSIYLTVSKIDGISGFYSNIGPSRNYNNTVVLFSGQR